MNQNETGVEPAAEHEPNLEWVSGLPEGIKREIVEYAISAWAMGSAYDVYKSLVNGPQGPDPEPGPSFVAAWEKEIDLVAENLESLALAGLKEAQCPQQS